MTEKYLLPCQCGQQNPIDLAQAGQTINCQCGQQLEVPTFRGIRQLAQAEISDSKKRQTTWSRSQGVQVSISIAVAVVAFSMAAFIIFQRSFLDTEKPPPVDMKPILAQVDQHDAVGIWNEWSYDSQYGLGDWEPAPYLIDRFDAKKLLNRAIGVSAVGLIAVIIGLCSALFDNKARRSQKKRAG